MKRDLWPLTGTAILFVGLTARSAALSTLGLLVLTLIGLSWLWTRWALHRLTYERKLSTERCYVGDHVSLEIVLTNRKLLALPFVVVSDVVEKPLKPLSTGIERNGSQWNLRTVVSLGWFQRLRLTHQFECTRRGYHIIGPATLESGDPFGLYSNTRQLPERTGVLVYPSLLDLPSLGLSKRFPFEGTRSARALVADPRNVVGTRAYTPGDPLRQIEWRASSRSGTLHSRLIRPTAEPTVVIFLDLASARHPWEGIAGDLVELMISLAATVAHQAHRARQAVGLYVNGVRSGTHQRVRIGASRGDAALVQVMEVLARVPPFPTFPFEELVRMERRNLPPGAAVVLITLFPERLTGQVQALKERGHEVHLADVRDYRPASTGGERVA